MKRTCILMLIGLLLMCFNAYADSPLTSTDFYKSYLDIEQVVKAHDQKIISKDLVKYIMDDNIPFDRVAAVINALGWDFDGKNNADKFLNIIKEIDNNEYVDFTKGNASGRFMFAMGYILALDDYFDVVEARKLMDGAFMKLDFSYSVAIVRSLVIAQDQINYNDRQGLGRTSKVSFNECGYQVLASIAGISAQDEMRERAVDNIFGYMNSYSMFCGQPETEEDNRLNILGNAFIENYLSGSH